MKKKLIILAFIATGYCSGTYAQDAITVTAGQSLMVSSARKPSIEGHAPMLAVDYLLSMQNNDAEWAQWLKLDGIDIEASYMNMRQVKYINGVTGSFGDAYALLASLDIPIVKFGSAEIIFSPGVGPAWVTKDFYNTANTNFAFGSRPTIESKAAVKFQWSIFSAGIDFRHLSNSDMSQSNCAFNRLGLFGGLSTPLGISAPENIGDNFEKNKHNLFNLQVIYGVEGRAVTGYYKTPMGGKYPDTVAVQRKMPGLPQMGLSLGYEHRFNSVIGATINADAVYSFTMFDWNRFFQTYESNYAAYGRITGGLSAGVEFWLGRAVFSATYGNYVVGKFVYVNNPSYLTFSGRYDITKHFSIEAKAYSRRFGGAGILVHL